MKHPIIEAEYREGRAWEGIVKNWMMSEGYIIKNSTFKEDKCFDIDFHFRKHKLLFTSASVKCNHPRYYDAPFIFEHQQVRDGKLVDSWWRTGKAKVYFYLKRHISGGGRLWMIDKGLVQDYVKEYGWDAKNVGISDERLKVQALNNMGNSNLSMLLQHTILKNELGCILLETDSLRSYL